MAGDRHAGAHAFEGIDLEVLIAADAVEKFHSGKIVVPTCVGTVVFILFHLQQEFCRIEHGLEFEHPGPEVAPHQAVALRFAVSKHLHHLNILKESGNGGQHLGGGESCAEFSGRVVGGKIGSQSLEGFGRSGTVAVVAALPVLEDEGDRCRP